DDAVACNGLDRATADLLAHGIEIVIDGRAVLINNARNGSQPAVIREILGRDVPVERVSIARVTAIDDPDSGLAEDVVHEVLTMTAGAPEQTVMAVVHECDRILGCRRIPAA